MVQKWNGLKDAEGEGVKGGSRGTSRTERCTDRFFRSLLFLFYFILVLYMFKTRLVEDLPLRDTGFVSSTALCYLLWPRAWSESCGSPETAGISEKKWCLSLGHHWGMTWVLCNQSKSCSLQGLRRTSPSRLMLMVTDCVLALWGEGWRKGIYVGRMLLQTITISCSCFLSYILPRCTHLQSMFPRFLLGKEKQEGLETFLLWTLPKSLSPP